MVDVVKLVGGAKRKEEESKERDAFYSSHCSSSHRGKSMPLNTFEENDCLLKDTI